MLRRTCRILYDFGRGYANEIKSNLFTTTKLLTSKHSVPNRASRILLLHFRLIKPSPNSLIAFLIRSQLHLFHFFTRFFYCFVFYCGNFLLAPVTFGFYCVPSSFFKFSGILELCHHYEQVSCVYIYSLFSSSFICINVLTGT